MKIIKYFFEFIIIISLFCIFKIIGLKNASNIGGILGKLIGPLFRSKKIIKQNIKTGLGEISEIKESEIINDMWSNIGRTFAEYVFLKKFKFNKKIYGISMLVEQALPCFKQWFGFVPDVDEVLIKKLHKKIK